MNISSTNQNSTNFGAIRPNAIKMATVHAEEHIPTLKRIDRLVKQQENNSFLDIDQRIGVGDYYNLKEKNCSGILSKYGMEDKAFASLKKACDCANLLQKLEISSQNAINKLFKNSK